MVVAHIFLEDLHVEVWYFILRSHVALEPLVSEDSIDSQSFTRIFFEHSHDEVKGRVIHLDLSAIQSLSGILFKAEPPLVRLSSFIERFLASQHHK